ncbi:S-layer homology domain-containing protein [Demequina sp. SO4-18]|uniref:S-layer homology domain-containing protein n=1 Tax=Demequina sp. SO4-18 TaxID=3401026 RepID=UPI003B5BEF06
MRNAVTRTASAVATMALGAAAVAGGATAATAAPDEETLASIYVHLYGPEGEKAFEVVDVPVGGDSELTSADVVYDPENLDGGVEVDVDLDGYPGGIAIGGIADEFVAADLTVELSGGFTLGGAYLVQDGLYGDDVDVEAGVGEETFHAYWNGDATGTTLNGTTYFWIFDADDFPFIDSHGDQALPTYTEHWMPIYYLGTEGISEGWETPQGSFEYRPYNRTTRDALAAFFYRLYGGEAAVSPDAEPFIDVSSDPDSPHYSEHWEAIYWMAEEGLSTGWPTAEGDEYRPTAQITRDAVAAFFFRLSEATGTPDSDPFVDVSSDPASEHYSEHATAIAWMHAFGLSEGWDTPAGAEYRPTAKVTRDAIAAFIFRAEVMVVPDIV